MKKYKFRRNSIKLYGGFKSK